MAQQTSFKRSTGKEESRMPNGEKPYQTEEGTEHIQGFSGGGLWSVPGCFENDGIWWGALETMGFCGLTSGQAHRLVGFQFLVLASVRVRVRVVFYGPCFRSSQGRVFFPLPFSSYRKKITYFHEYTIQRIIQSLYMKIIITYQNYRFIKINIALTIQGINT